MCGIRGLGRCGVRTANDTLFALGFVVVLSVVAEIATVAVGLMVGEIYPHLSSSRRYDGIAEGGCRRYYGGMVLLSTFVFIPAGSVARIIVPIAGAIGVLTVVFAVPNAKNDE